MELVQDENAPIQQNGTSSVKSIPMSSLCSSVPEKVSLFNMDNMLSTASSKALRYSEWQWGTMEAVDNSRNEWELVLEDPPMKLYSRKPEPGDSSSLNTYQLRASVEGISAQELCRYFWDPAYRLEWEVAIDTAPTVLHRPDESSVVSHQFFTTIWPVKHRHTIFWSVNRPLPKTSPAVLSRQYVVNYSTNYPLVDENLNTEAGKMVFAFLDVIIVCETRLKEGVPAQLNPAGDRPTISRQDIITEAAYICRIDPGGWIPSALANMTSRSEYPRFFKRLVQCAANKCTDLPLEL